MVLYYKLFFLCLLAYLVYFLAYGMWFVVTRQDMSLKKEIATTKPQLFLFSFLNL